MKISLGQLLHLLAFASMMAVGQLLFKQTAVRLGSNSFVSTVLTAPRQATFWLACSLYGAATVYWIWLLARVPLCIAYPISSIAIVIVPLLGWLWFGEVLSARFWVGLALFVGGAVMISR
jgi:multidrug transporter EmrE-like cation transporter